MRHLGNALRLAGGRDRTGCFFRLLERNFSIGKLVFLQRQLLGKEYPSHGSFAEDQTAVNGMQLVNISIGDCGGSIRIVVFDRMVIMPPLSLTNLEFTGKLDAHRSALRRDKRLRSRRLISDRQSYCSAEFPGRGR